MENKKDTKMNGMTIEEKEEFARRWEIACERIRKYASKGKGEPKKFESNRCSSGATFR